MVKDPTPDIGEYRRPAQVKSELFGKEFGKRVLMPNDGGPATRKTSAAVIRRLQDEDVLVKS